MKAFAGCYLLVQSLGCLVWWVLLLWSKSFREWFVARGAPDGVIFALGPGDMIFFIFVPLLVVYGFWRDTSWSWPLFCLHAGAATYASLYAIMLAFLTRGELWPGAVMMLPCSFIPAYCAWKLRPTASIR